MCIVHTGTICMSRPVSAEVLKGCSKRRLLKVLAQIAME